MSKLELVILGEEEIPDLPAPDQTGTGLGAEAQSLASNFEKLARAWPEVMRRLREIVEADAGPTSASGFATDTIEFSIGIEGGVNIGFAATANASAKITFKRGQP